jgi:hypothetical protein
MPLRQVEYLASGRPPSPSTRNRCRRCRRRAPSIRPPAPSLVHSMDIEDWDALSAGDAKATQRRLLIPMAEDGMPVANQQHAQALVQAGTARYHESDDEDDVSQRMKGKRRARDGAAIADERFRSHDATASPGSAITSSFLIPSTTERSRSDARLPSRRRPPHPPSAREATLGSSLGARHLHHGALHDVQVHEDYEYARLLEADQQQVLSFLPPSNWPTR